MEISADVPDIAQSSTLPVHCRTTKDQLVVVAVVLVDHARAWRAQPILRLPLNLLWRRKVEDAVVLLLQVINRHTIVLRNTWLTTKGWMQ